MKRFLIALFSLAFAFLVMPRIEELPSGDPPSPPAHFELSSLAEQTPAPMLLSFEDLDLEPDPAGYFFLGSQGQNSIFHHPKTAYYERDIYRRYRPIYKPKFSPVLSSSGWLYYTGPIKIPDINKLNRLHTG